MKRYNLMLTIVGIVLACFVFGCGEDIETGVIKGLIVLEYAKSYGEITVELKGTEFATTTDAYGKFILTGIPVGIYTLVATKANFGTCKKSVKVESDVTTDMSLIIDSRISFSVQKTVITVKNLYKYPHYQNGGFSLDHHVNTGGAISFRQEITIIEGGLSESHILIWSNITHDSDWNILSFSVNIDGVDYVWPWKGCNNCQRC